jgi:hypothetical protein
VLETLADLEEMLAYLHDHAAQVGRTEPIDVMYMSFEGGVPGEDDWDGAAHIADVRAQADLGVNWQAVNAVGSTRSEVLDMLRSYGDNVISALR